MTNFIKSLTEMQAVNTYLERIGAEPRSLLKAVVKEKHGQYWKDVAIINFDRSGVVSAPDAFMPTDTELPLITAAFAAQSFPEHVQLAALNSTVPDPIKNANPDDVFEFRGIDDRIIMLQLRREGKNGEKNYVPYTFWSDDQWRAAEPEDALPLWGLPQIKNHTTVFIHEGAKAARAMRDLVNPQTPQDKERLRSHPWGHEMSDAAHLGWIGGALSPARTDWGALRRAGVKRAYVVSDNDAPGLGAVTAISFRLNAPTFHVQFTDEWPASFDLGDDFPDSFFKDIGGLKHYTGPAFRSCVHPATWATDLIPNKKGKPTVVLREVFRDQWAYIEEADLFVCREMPEVVRSEAIANKMMAAFSHAGETTRLLLKSYKGRSTRICYRPDVKGRSVTDRGTSAINLHIPTDIKATPGDVRPFLDFMEYLIPKEQEREGAYKWIATLIARPAIRMEYGMLLVSEMQGIGKTTLGASILAPLVGMHNTGFPTEKSIVDSNFNGWIAQKRLIVVNEIYSGHSWKAYNALKGYITDRDIEVNEKYQRSYMIDNWAHIMACSNSMEALRMEQDDRRWFYPEVSETPWGRDNFVKFHNWIASGGLGMILHWAQNHKEFVRHGDRAPMTDRKREMIAGSRSKPQQDAIALAENATQVEAPIVFTMRAVSNWVRANATEKVYDSDYHLRKAMQDGGLIVSQGRIFVEKRQQNVMYNKVALALVRGLEPKEAADILKAHLKQPEEIMENEL